MAEVFFEDTMIAHCRQYGLVGYVIIGHERSTLKRIKDYADTRRSAAINVTYSCIKD